ncbi:MAG TPA: lipoprotein-releasing ABC transporter permease subunit [Dongiaceae bacterium]
MWSSFEWLVAMRYLRPQRREGFISLIAVFSFLGIMLGVAILIIVMSVMNGFRHELLGRIIGLNGHLTLQSVQGPLPDYEVLAKAIKSLPMVKAADPMIQGQAMVTKGTFAYGAVVLGIRPEDLREKTTLSGNIKVGSLDKFKGLDVVMIGYHLAQNLGVTVGQEITLISPQGRDTVAGFIPRIKSFTVVAIFDVGMYEYDSAYVFMPLEAAQLYFMLPQQASQIEISVDDPDRTAAAAAAILARTGSDYRITDWKEANASFFGAIEVEGNVMFLILTLIIIVAAFNIISSQIMLVKEKGRAIAILRTMGATRGMILRIFLISGASIGVVGTIAGFALGLAFADNIESIRQGLQSLLHTTLFPAEVYFLSQLPAIVDPREVATVVIMALALSFLATIYPAWRAARLDPVEALRYE